MLSTLEILRYPDARLHKVAKPVEVVDERIRDLSQAMLATMYDANGIGLAATQVDVHERLIVLDVSEERNEPLVIINPKIVWAREDTQMAEEGQMQTLQATDLLAVCIQHEMDHLVGKVFVEYLSPLKRNRIKIKLQKQLREDR